MKKPTRKTLLMLVVLGITFGCRTSKEGSQLERAEVTHPRVIRLSGTVRVTDVKIAFEVPGTLREVHVSESEPVKKGMILARLGSERLMHEKEKALAAVTAARSRLAQLETSLAKDRETIPEEIERRQSDLKEAESFLSQLLAGSRRQEIEEARAALDAARTTHNKTKRDWERAQTLKPEEDITVADLDRLRGACESGEADVREAEQRLSLLKEGARQETIESARARVQAAKAGVRQAEALRIEIRRKERELNVAKAEIDSALADVKVVETKISQTIATSPIDGVVISENARVGEVVEPGTIILRLADLDRVTVHAYIGGQDLLAVKEGMTVKVKPDGVPPIEGIVSFISSQGEFTPPKANMSDERSQLVYKIKVEVRNLSRVLKPGMPVDAEISVEK